MAKHTEAVKSIDEFRAPWETEGGGDAEIDKPKLRRWIHNLLVDKAKAQDARDEATEKVTALEADLEKAKDEAASANGDEAQKKITRLEERNRELQKQIDDRKAADEHEALRKDVIGYLPEKYAKYVVGDDREALEKSLEDVKADFGIEDDPSDGENDLPARTTPRQRLVNGSDPKPGAGASDEIDWEKVADDVVGGGSVFR